ncbi:D-3-phosphoglycerate dehydrogenase [Aminobacter niigataensis]|uniref:D-3-phosphoglycerate dehydrogenase n=1 Tax=Aminobacter niigataensis TaxID=83265 RepID=A0ABR6L3B6_9HYPH|nr:hydroxyacid dehydrogenase [Aminobacter niigataensis]MBB4651305.1 D-3-phosphoglycerate dehydrogenase [Aminobacter niigataensis]
MTTTIVTVGGRMAAEGLAMLENAGVECISTEAYPRKSEVLELIERHQPAALVIRLVEMVDADMLAASRNLKIVAKHGVGTNDIDVAAAKVLGIPVIMATGANAHSVAEHALGLILALAKDFLRQDSHIRNGLWDKKLYAGRELRGQKIGLVGFGLIGQILARMAAPIGMQVSAYDPFAPDEAFADGVSRTTSLDALLGESDVVSLHCPLTDATRGLIGAREIALMKPTAYLVNTARGEVVDEPALIAALQGGRIAGAGLDSFAEEPPVKSPLWQLPNLILTPHVAGVTEDARRAVSIMTAGNVLAFLRGEQLAKNLHARV